MSPAPRRSKQPRYDPGSIRELFDGMAATYGAMNLITSFGFAARWRRQAVEALPRVGSTAKVADLMSGMGELWRSLAKLDPPPAEVVAVDLSPEMARRAVGAGPFAVALRVEDVLEIDLAPGSFDAIVSSFGLKTFDADQQDRLARRVADWLRPGGVFSFVEISVPPSRLLRPIYMFYLKRVIPSLGRLFLGDPAHYRMLGFYTEAFGDCRHFTDSLARAGLHVEPMHFVFGCATGVRGSRPPVE
jgi:demethylmenaquinone methyltransferase/2-methoxy-6-polyprenyl-1,4-benzoquinol methylase